MDILETSSASSEYQSAQYVNMRLRLPQGAKILVEIEKHNF